MNRRKRRLDGEEVKSTSLWLRASVREKIDMLTPPGGSMATTIEAITEYVFARQMKKTQRNSNTL